MKKYEIPQSEINNVKKLLSKKENLNKLKKNQIIQFTLDLENSKKVVSLTYPISRTKKIKISRNLVTDNFDYNEIITDLKKKNYL